VEIRVDIDRTLCSYTREGGKKKAVPNREVIDRINKLHDEGNTIIVWTSRAKHQKPLTEKQLDEWGLRYDEIDFDKPIFDLFIDDRSVNVAHWLCGYPIPDLGEDI